jgi:hypothetical protein
MPTVCFARQTDIANYANESASGLKNAKALDPHAVELIEELAVILNVS